MVTVQIRFLLLYTGQRISNLMFDLRYDSGSVFSAVITKRKPPALQCLLFISMHMYAENLDQLVTLSYIPGAEPVNDNTSHPIDIWTCLY